MKKKMEIVARSLPFWSWNDKLEKEKLLKQIEWMKKHGFGGFFMHARAGLKTEYLSAEWFECIRECIQYAREQGMEAWAYDENGWPSGFTGGKLLEDENNLEWYLQAEFGKKDEKAFVSYDVSGLRLRRLYMGEACETALNVYKRVSVSTVDILDGRVVDKFIEETHERYKSVLGEGFNDLFGFFTDEPQYCRAGTPFPHEIADIFKEEYSEDILDGLGLLFIEKDEYRQFRYRYWKTCQSLMLKNFAKKIYEWCDKNGQKLTGHYVEERDLYAQMLFNGGVMPFYEYEHIPGIDWLCRRFMSVVPARQVGSVAAQLGKREVLTETYAMTGWDATPQELKVITEFQYLYGPNRTCQHLLPYSEQEERKRDHPAHFTPLNPWIEQGMYAFNRYFDWLGETLQNSEEPVSVAVLHPIRSAYFCYQHGKEESTAELDSALLSFCNLLAENQIAFHFIDETLLGKYGFVKDGKIGCGECEYTYLLFPKCYTMDTSTEKLVREFVKQGGKVYLADEKPQYLEGEPFDYAYLETNMTIDEIKAVQPYRISYQGGLIHSVYKKGKDGDFIVLLNISDDETAVGKLTVNGAKNLAEYDFNADNVWSFDGSFKLEPFRSTMILVDKTGNTRREKQTVLLGGEMEVVERDENCLLLDFAHYSKDGEIFSKRYPLPAIFKALLTERYEGDLWLKFPFEIDEVPKKISVKSEYGARAKLAVNGVITDRKNIAAMLQRGNNELTVQLRFYENEKVYLALFGKGVTETLKNCLVFDTYLENVYLCGDFGVYAKGGFRSGEEKNVLIAKEFYIAKRQACVGELTQSGEPFFAGRVVLKKKLMLAEPSVKLKLNGRVHAANVTINGINLGACTFDGEIDISAVAKRGENEVIVELFTSPRNCLGPHHDALWEENLMLSSYGFDMFEGWEDFHCEQFRENYSFVKSGILPETDSVDFSVIYYGIYKDNQKD